MLPEIVRQKLLQYLNSSVQLMCTCGQENWDVDKATDGMFTIQCKSCGLQGVVSFAYGVLDEEGKS